MNKYLVNLNLYATFELQAKDKDDARDIAESLNKEKILEILKEEVENGGLEIGTIEEL